MLSILFCYSAPPNDPCINITHTKPIMSRCLSSSVILPPSNPSCPITPPLPCHPVPMSTAVRRALRFRPSSLSSAPRIAFAAVNCHDAATTASTVGQIRQTNRHRRGFLCILIFTAVLWFYIHIIFILYPPLYFFRNFCPFLFTIRPPRPCVCLVQMD